MLVHLDGPGEHAERQLHAIHKDEHHYENPNHAVRTEDILHGDSVWLLAPHKTHSWQGIIHAAAWSSTPPASLRDPVEQLCWKRRLPQNHQKVSGHVSNHYARKDRHAKLKGVGSGWSQHDHESNRRDCSGDVDDPSNQVDGVGDQRPLILFAHFMAQARVLDSPSNNERNRHQKVDKCNHTERDQLPGQLVFGHKSCIGPDSIQRHGSSCS
mmetsp:Transcript_69408/g.162552  ORF Transcript_69408/g.162552 Transcript_69408/m.162552 type:complete len:212 (-) Transcript_69408:20-655(-)